MEFIKLKTITELEKEYQEQAKKQEKLFCPLIKENCKGVNCAFYKGECAINTIAFEMHEIDRSLMYIHDEIGELNNILETNRKNNITLSEEDF